MGKCQDHLPIVIINCVLLNNSINPSIKYLEEGNLGLLSNIPWQDQTRKDSSNSGLSRGCSECFNCPPSQVGLSM